MRPDLRLVLMSATVNEAKFSAYFGGCPVRPTGVKCALPGLPVGGGNLQLLEKCRTNACPHSHPCPL